MTTRTGSKIASIVFSRMTLVLLLSLVLAPAITAQEPSLLYATAEAGTKLIAISLEAVRVRVIGDIGFPFSLALAPCPPNAVRYTITNTFDPNNAQLATLNLGTGAATRVGSPLGQALSIMGMTCSPDGTLYAIGQFNFTDPFFNSLYTVNRETGLASWIGSTGVLDPSDPSGFSGFLMALAFAPDGTLYGVNSASTLFRVNKSTGEATKLVDFLHSASARPLVGVMGLAIDSDGNFYVSDFAPVSFIYVLNVATGVATPVLNTGLPFVHNIAFKAPVTAHSETFEDGQ